MTTKHTAGPWRVGDRQPDNHAVNILDTRGFLTAQARAAGAGWTEAKANAALIVRAVNSHDAMVEAVKNLLGLVEAYQRNARTVECPGYGLNPVADTLDTIKAARAALEKAGAV
jgi:hypothetical protein